MMLFAAAGVMNSCSLETISEDLQNAQTMSNTDLENAPILMAPAGSCEDDCIEPGSEMYFPVYDMASGSAGPNTKSVSYKAYNTETDFVVEVTYAITAGPSKAKATITIDIYGNEVQYTEVSSGSTVSHMVPLSEDWAGCDEVAFSVVQEGLGTPVTFSESYALIPVCFEDVTNPITGKTWMDRNLGATQVATSSTDAASYGDLYQWGRAADGHQVITSATTGNLSSSDTPGHGDFIITSSYPVDWRSPQNHNLWQGVDGVNNPCPNGYRLPTDAELNAERLSWSSNNAAGAFASPLKFPVPGARHSHLGYLHNNGSVGYYWSSTISAGALSRTLYFNRYGATINHHYRTSGLSVRCIKD